VGGARSLALSKRLRFKTEAGNPILLREKGMETVCTFNALSRLIRTGLRRNLSTSEIEILLSQIRIRKQDFQKFVVENSESYSRTSIACSAFAELLVLTWMPTQESPIHDHASSNCGIRVLEGKLTETIYQAVENIEGVARMIGVSDWSTGIVGSSSLATIHKVTNQTDERLISLHLYSPPLLREEMKIYREVRHKTMSANN